MKYRDLFAEWFKDRPACLLSVATTGVGNSDDIVGVWYKIGDKPVEFLVVSGVDPTKAEAFSHISKTFVDNHGLPREAVAETLTGIFKTCTVLTYNPVFMKKFLMKLQSPLLNDCLGDMLDIQSLIHAAEVRSAFDSPSKCGLVNFRMMVETWIRPVFPAIRKSILRLCPEWIESADFPVPSSLVSGMYASLQALAAEEVPFLISANTAPAGSPMVLPLIPKI